MAFNIASTAYLRQLPLSEDSVHPEIRMPDILLYDFFNSGKKIVRIGRCPTNEVHLHSERIPLILELHHSYIELQVLADGDYVYSLIDNSQKSLNGCYVGSKMIAKGGREVIQHGAVLSFGEPLNVRRDDRVQRNPFRFEFRIGFLIPPLPTPTRSM
ncbi:hypothetical protein CYMTET_43088 [Cymbomonas tetramitiformis]|nr:hypothetical protein CYMTET_43088 [Cymbomonas tetramitiformis]